MDHKPASHCQQLICKVTIWTYSIIFKFTIWIHLDMRQNDWPQEKDGSSVMCLGSLIRSSLAPHFIHREYVDPLHRTPSEPLELVHQTFLRRLSIINHYNWFKSANAVPRIWWLITMSPLFSIRGTERQRVLEQHALLTLRHRWCFLKE